MTDIIVTLENEDDEIDEILICKGVSTMEDVEKKIKDRGLEIELENCPLVLEINSAEGLEVLTAFADVEVKEIK